MSPRRGRAKTSEKPSAAPPPTDAIISPAPEVLGESVYRAIIEQTDDLVSLVDATGRYRYVSPSFTRVLGYELSVLLGRNAFDFVHPADVDALLARFAHAVSHRGRTTSEEYRFLHADGSWRTLEGSGINLLDDPSVRGVVVNTRDVTERKNQADRLAEQGRLLGDQLAELEQLYRTAPVGLALMDLDLRFVRVNDELAAMNGPTPAQHIGRSLHELLPQYAPAIEPMYRSVIETGQPVLGHEVHGSVPAQPSVEKDLLVNYYRLEDAGGHTIGVSAVVQDITARKEAERGLERSRDELESRVRKRTDELVRANQALRDEITERERAQDSLRRSEERYRQLVENITDVIFTLDLEGNLTYISPAIERVGGYLPAEVMGRSFLEFIHPGDVASTRDSFQRTLAGSVEPAQYRVLDKTGRVRWMRSRSQLIVENGTVVGLQGVLTDITERHLAEAQARQQWAELAHAQRLTTAGEMTAEIAHQMNQPLAAIVNFAGGLAARLRDGTIQPEVMGEVVARISGEAQRAGEIIRRLRAFLRKGDSSVTAATCDLNRLVTHVYGLIEEDFRRDGVEARIALEPRLPPLRLDTILIEQVVLNVLRNALEAMAESALRRLEVATRIVDEKVFLTVADSGIGLPAGAEHRVFEAFFTTKPEGLGLGLSVSRSIIEASGGRLWAIPNIDCGTTVGFALPLAELQRPAT